MQEAVLIDPARILWPVPHRVIESGKEEGDFSPRLEWEVQKKLL